METTGRAAGAVYMSTHAHNAAVQSAQLAAAFERQAHQLRAELVRLERLADFGSANSPRITCGLTSA